MALPLLEKVRVLCADVERRRLAVANCLAADPSSDEHQQPKDGGNNNDASAAAAAAGAGIPSHDNVHMIRDHFVLRQCDAAREASAGILDTLDTDELEHLSQTFVQEAGFLPASRLAAANRAVEQFDIEASSLREYHRLHGQRSYVLPSVERPAERDMHKVRAALFAGPERHGRAVDLTGAFRLLSEFLELSARDNEDEAQQSSAGVAVVHRDIGVEYPAFVADPVGECSRLAPARKAGARTELYRRCLEAAIGSIEAFVSKTKPLTAEAELADIQGKADTALAGARAAVNASRGPQQQLAPFSSKVRNAWRDYVGAANVSGTADTVVVAADVRRLATMLRDGGQALRLQVVGLAALEEKLVLLCEGGVGESVLTASAEHLRRVALRTKAEELQDEADDDEKFQADMFRAFYGKKPLSDRVELTVTGTEDLRAAKAATAGGVDAAAAKTMEEEEEERLKNPKNFPLDPLGNPIPVWLWKLHGLGKKFHCEVCGFTYAGEKNYTQHFNEARHERGLERLGIKVTARTAPFFRLVPTREGALAAQRKIEEGEEQARRRLRGDDEEVEDATGTVLARKQLKEMR